MKKLTTILSLLLSFHLLAAEAEDVKVITQIEQKEAFGLVDPTMGGGGDVRFPPHPRRMANYDIGLSTTQTFSLQLKERFAGVEIKAGPVISFNQQYSLTVYLLAGGMESLTQSLGDYGTLLNIYDDRKVITWCTVRSAASYDLSAGASLTFHGIGASAEANTWQALNVSQTSKPYYIDKYKEDGKTYTTLEDVIENCKQNFFWQVKPGLDEDLQKLVSQLVYENQQTECVEDSQCQDFFSDQKKKAKKDAVARCVPTDVGNGQVIKLCRLRGTQGKSCPIYNKKGRRLNSRKSIPCDEGFQCQTTVEGGWSFNVGALSYTFWQAACKPTE